jgi:thiol-disulfide isomerase/thioredoxin
MRFTTSPRLRILSAVLVLGVIAGAGAAAYQWRASAGEGGVCQAAQTTAAALDPLTRGEVAAVQVEKTPRPMPQLTFRDADGATHSIADFRGKTVLVNLWATWCVPCRREMPALDALEAKLGGDDFQVVAINIDTRNTDKPHAWLKENGITRLAYYADPEAKVFQALKEEGKAFGMPTTVIVDHNGCMVASLAGPAEWASDDALSLIRAALKS